MSDCRILRRQTITSKRFVIELHSCIRWAAIDHNNRAELEMCLASHKSTSLISRSIFFWTTSLVLIFVCFVIDHIKEPELVNPLTGANHTKPIPQLFLLEVFLSPVLPY